MVLTEAILQLNLEVEYEMSAPKQGCDQYSFSIAGTEYMKKHNLSSKYPRFAYFSNDISIQ